MTATVRDIEENITATVKAIAATREPSLKFSNLDDDAAALSNQPSQSGSDRMFQVEMQRIEHPTPGECYWSPGEREVHATIMVMVGYSRTGNREDDRERVLSDLHDIETAINNQTNWQANTIYQQTLAISAPEETEAGFWILKIPVLAHYIEAAS